VAYMIVSGAKGPNGETLALNAHGNGSIVVGNAEFATAGMWWSLIYDLSTEHFAMVNAGSLESGTPSVLSLAQGDPQSLLLSPLAGGLAEINTWDVAPGGPALAVRPTFSTSFNLNVEGSGPYSVGNPVIAYDGWGGGQPNEVWTFVQLGADDYPWNVAFVPECAPGLCLTANPEAEGSALTIEPPGEPDSHYAPSQLWSATYVIDGITPLGPVFVNAETIQAVTASAKQPLITKDLGSLDGTCAWLTGAGPDSGTTMIRALDAQDLYWNVAGGGPYNAGNAVVLWPFQGGAANEQWYASIVPGDVTLRPRMFRMPMRRPTV